MFRTLIDTAAPRGDADNASFAVVDLETTGLYANGHDRIVEIAVVRMNARGEQLADFVTLVNPERDIGPTRIHGIKARDVRDAPLFREIAGDVVAQLSGTVLVGHNARFDSDFLRAEFSRLGHQIPQSPAVCTLVLARKLHAATCYKLGALCRELAIPHDRAHTALCDARATAMLFADLVRRALQDPPRGRAALAELGCESWTPPSESAWPKLRASGRRCLRPLAPEPTEPSTDSSYVASLVSRLAPPPSTASAASLEYLALLDRALEDRRVTKDEADLLFATAVRWGLSRNDVVLIHHEYLASLVAVALRDGVLTDAELSDLREVAELLGYNRAYAEALVNAALATARVDQQPRVSSVLKGLSVCFTGESVCSRNGVAFTRADAEHIATEAGLRVQANVTKSLDVLVLADPDTMSGKAKKARQYGTRLIAERVFWRELGVVID